MIADNVKNEYFEWLYDLVCGERCSGKCSYRKLMIFLHDVEFRYSLPMDENRAHDGIDLRYRFSISKGFESDYFSEYLRGPCSVLEMMIALSVRCEENIMDDTKYGNRTSQWFWGMINNLGLGDMYDSRFDKDNVNAIVQRFLDRKYAPNGKGGLFTIRNCKYDLRDVEIWYQLNWYLDGIIGG